MWNTFIFLVQCGKLAVQREPHTRSIDSISHICVCAPHRPRHAFLLFLLFSFVLPFFTILRILACEWKNIISVHRWEVKSWQFKFHPHNRMVSACVRAHFTYKLHVYCAFEWRVKEKWDVSFWAISFRCSAVYVYFRCRYPDETDPRQEKCVRATSWKFNYHQIVLGCWCAYFKYSFTEWSSPFHRFSFAGRSFSQSGRRVYGICVNVRKKERANHL